MHSVRAAAALAAILLMATFVLAACGDDDDSTAPSVSPSATLAGSPTASPDPLVPPLEGPPRDAYLGERQDFRKNPDYQLPKPNDVPTPSDAADPVLNPPAEFECPDDWQTLFRGPEGFQLCYPLGWYVLTDAYKNSPNEERWYTGGVFKFSDESPDHQLAHVSVYAIPQFTRPFPYTRDCPTPFSVILDGQPAVVCPSFPAEHPEARIVSYHVFREGFDYFFNVALYYKWDADAGAYTQDTDGDAFNTALEIIHSVQFLAVPTPVPTSPPSVGQ